MLKLDDALLESIMKIPNALGPENPIEPLFAIPVVFRAEELETALMEMVKLDNRRELSARVCLLSL